MFSDDITSSDAFLDMPEGAQNLYFHLGMNADDDGFIGSPKMVMRAIRASEDSYKLLIAKKFLIHFEKGVCVIKHWRVNNQIRKDRYSETKYIDEKQSLYIKENGAYTQDSTKGLPVPKGHFTTKEMDNSEPGNHLATTRQPSIGKYSIGKDSNTQRVTFKKPTLEEVTAYCKERENKVDPQQFVDHYESNGWRVGGRSPMKDWKASVRTWEKNNFQRSAPKAPANVYKNESNGSMDKIKAKVNKE